MARQLRFIKKSIVILIVILSALTFVSAQNAPPPPPPPPRPVITGNGYPNAMKEDDDRGSVVRGRVVYQDSNLPVRRGWIGFRKIKEFVETPPNANGNLQVSPTVPYYGEKYVLTNDAGEFTIRGVKSGIYQPVMKVPGVLNPTASDVNNPQFQQIAVDGTNEVRTTIGVVRGAAISGRILYSDGSPVIGAKVQIFIELLTEAYSAGSRDDNMTDTTDDRGVYRLNGLPAGEYIVRVVEPALHGDASKPVESYSVQNFDASSELKTYYPNAENAKEAVKVPVFLGQEQADINITIPDRRLFKVGGRVIAKSSQTPLADVVLRFEKLDAERLIGYVNNQSKTIVTDAQGLWSFADLPKGKYLVRAERMPEYEYKDGAAKLKPNQVKLAPYTKEIELDTADLTDLVIELSTAVKVSGFVSVEGGKPLPGRIFVNAVDETFRNSVNDSFTATENVKNADKLRRPFTLDGFSAGKFYLLTSAGPDYYVKSIRSGGTDLLAAPLEIKEGENIENVEIILSTDTGTITGKINNYKAGEQLFVILIPINRQGLNALSSIQEARVDGNGNFSGKAAPGDYNVFIGTRKNAPNFSRFQEWLEKIRAASPTITIRANQTSSTTLDYPVD